jgi:GTP-binding protein HflX
MEHVVAVGIKYPYVTHQELNSSLNELSFLLTTAGGVVNQTVIQKRDKPDPAFLIGKGKAEEIARLMQSDSRLTTVVFDDEISPSQQRNLEEIIDKKIITRTRVILDIFAARARTREGSLQVELAQLEYNLPRLTKRGIWLDNQTGGIGTRRGPGERKLEYDRRYLRDEIVALKREIEKVRLHRNLQRNQRQAQRLPTIALAGYTNAGKSTLLNKMLEITRQHTTKVYADNKLFATLDPTVRRVVLPRTGQPVLVIDTVGFIRKLPLQIVAAFKSTLEEVTEASYILHVIDSSSPDYREQTITVEKTLKDICCDGLRPIMNVYNKYDISGQTITDDTGLYVSAKTGFGIDKLLNHLAVITKNGTKQ